MPPEDIRECPQSENSEFLGEFSEWRLTEGHRSLDQKIADVGNGSVPPVRSDEKLPLVLQGVLSSFEIFECQQWSETATFPSGRRETYASLRHRSLRMAGQERADAGSWRQPNFNLRAEQLRSHAVALGA
jgi:hypothetical protein